MVVSPWEVRFISPESHKHVPSDCTVHTTFNRDISSFILRWPRYERHLRFFLCNIDHFPENPLHLSHYFSHLSHRMACFAVQSAQYRCTHHSTAKQASTLEYEATPSEEVSGFQLKSLYHVLERQPVRTALYGCRGPRRTQVDTSDPRMPCKTPDQPDYEVKTFTAK